MRVCVLIWLQAQLGQRHQALHTSAERDECSIILHASDITVRTLPGLKTLQDR